MDLEILTIRQTISDKIMTFLILLFKQEMRYYKKIITSIKKFEDDLTYAHYNCSLHIFIL